MQVWRRVWRLGGRLCMLIVRVKNSHRMLCSRFVPDYFESFRKCLLCLRWHQSMLVVSSQALVDDALEQSFGHRSMTTWTTFAHLTLAAIEARSRSANSGLASAPVLPDFEAHGLKNLEVIAQIRADDLKGIGITTGHAAQDILSCSEIFRSTTSTP